MIPLQQSAEFARALGLLGRRAEVVDLSGAGTALVARRRVALLGEVGSVIRGPLWAPDAGVKARAAALAASGLLMVEAEAPCPALRLAGFRQVATAAHVAEIDLGGARRGALAPKWRHVLARAEASELRVREEAWRGEDHPLLAREAAMRRARGYRALPPAFARAFAAANPGAARMWTASLGGEPVAFMLVLVHGATATYHMGWSGDQGRAAGAHHLLLTRTADALAAWGLARLDLGAVDTVSAPGLARFKIGAGATVRALGGSWLRLARARVRG